MLATSACDAQRLVDLAEALGAGRAQLADQRAQPLQLGAQLDADLVEPGVDDVLLGRQVGLHAGGDVVRRRAQLLAVEHRGVLQRSAHGGVSIVRRTQRHLVHRRVHGIGECLVMSPGERVAGRGGTHHRHHCQHHERDDHARHDARGVSQRARTPGYQAVALSTAISRHPEGMPRRNRVDPWGDLHAVAARGLFTGNRGCLVDDAERVVRHHQSAAVDHVPNGVPGLAAPAGRAAGGGRRSSSSTMPSPSPPGIGRVRRVAVPTTAPTETPSPPSPERPIRCRPGSSTSVSSPSGTGGDGASSGPATASSWTSDTADAARPAPSSSTPTIGRASLSPISSWRSPSTGGATRGRRLRGVVRVLTPPTSVAALRGGVRTGPAPQRRSAETVGMTPVRHRRRVHGPPADRQPARRVHRGQRDRRRPPSALGPRDEPLRDGVRLPARGPMGTRRIRIFTTTTELPFAGHPVLGTAFVLGGDRDEIRLETGGHRPGDAPARATSGIVFGRMVQPIPTWAPFDRVDDLLAGARGRRSELPGRASTTSAPGTSWSASPDGDAVAALRPDLAALATLDTDGIDCFAGAGRRGVSRRSPRRRESRKTRPRVGGRTALGPPGPPRPDRLRRRDRDQPGRRDGSPQHAARPCRRDGGSHRAGRGRRQRRDRRRTARSVPADPSRFVLGMICASRVRRRPGGSKPSDRGRQPLAPPVKFHDGQAQGRCRPAGRAGAVGVAGQRRGHRGRPRARCPA